MCVSGVRGGVKAYFREDLPDQSLILKTDAMREFRESALDALTRKRRIEDPPSIRRRENRAMAVKAIPAGYHTVTPFLVVKGAAKMIDFIKQAFGAEEVMRMPMPSGEIMHAEIKIGDSMVMLTDAMNQAPTSSSTFLYVNDVDGVYKRALKAGAKSISEPANMFWGDRFAQVGDSFGNRWSIATHVEDVPPQEIGKRAAAAMKQQGK